MAPTTYDPNTPYQDRPTYPGRSGYDRRGEDPPRARSLGEHVFIWIAWALAAAFWGATLTTLVGILQAAGQTSSTLSAPGAPGGMLFLVLVVAAFLALAGALAYASVRSAGQPRRVADGATAALYGDIDRQGGDDMTSRSPDLARPNAEFR